SRNFGCNRRPSVEQRTVRSDGAACRELVWFCGGGKDRRIGGGAGFLLGSVYLAHVRFGTCAMVAHTVFGDPCVRLCISYGFHELLSFDRPGIFRVGDSMEERGRELARRRHFCCTCIRRAPDRFCSLRFHGFLYCTF